MVLCLVCVPNDNASVCLRTSAVVVVAVAVMLLFAHIFILDSFLLGFLVLGLGMFPAILNSHAAKVSMVRCGMFLHTHIPVVLHPPTKTS